ncbi:MAG: hypothetical protein AB1690_02535 [Candidatus Zixiibacteriota bacterium]
MHKGIDHLPDDIFRWPGDNSPLVMLCQEQRLLDEFRKIGLEEGSRSWEDYRRAKEYFFAGRDNDFIRGLEYDFFVHILVNYLKL